MAEARPDLLAEWDHPLNSQEGWHPDKVSLMSGKPIHWIRTDECHLGLLHRWQTQPRDRVASMTSSPYLSGQAVCVCNSLALNCKAAAAFWDPVLNPDTPNQVTVQSTRVRHWKPPDGGQWQQSVVEHVRTCRQNTCLASLQATSRLSGLYSCSEMHQWDTGARSQNTLGGLLLRLFADVRSVMWPSKIRGPTPSRWLCPCSPPLHHIISQPIKNTTNAKSRGQMPAHLIMPTNACRTAEHA